MIACATHRVTTSASIKIRLAFFAGSGRMISSAKNTAISNRSRSASIVPPRSTVRIGTADFDLTAAVAYRRATTPAVELLI